MTLHWAVDEEAIVVALVAHVPEQLDTAIEARMRGAGRIAG